MRTDLDAQAMQQALDVLLKDEAGARLSHREAIAALQSRLSAPVGDAEPVARLLHWHGPSHYPVPHGGIAARTFAEFSKESADKSDSYWKNGEPLYRHPAPDAVRRETVEACARIAETMERKIPMLGQTENYPGEYGSEYDQGAGDALSECAAAIRAMLKGE